MCSRRLYDHWSRLWQLPVMRYATLFFVLSVLLHAWVGVRNIFRDYVKATGLRLVLYVLVILALVAYGAVQLTGTNVNAIFSGISDKLGEAAPAATP